jgi:hypothetical protein
VQALRPSTTSVPSISWLPLVVATIVVFPPADRPKFLDRSMVMRAATS